MQTITLETRIAAPIERCFLLSLSMDLHVASAQQTGERAIAGVTHSLIGMGESVTWRGRHFGLMLTHASRITAYERPTFFQDTMTQGLFRSFVHDHFFEDDGNDATLMRDVLRFAAPLGPLGWLAETIFLQRHLRRFLEERNRVIQEIAESSDGWQRYLAPR